jgi:hypothetical protein
MGIEIQPTDRPDYDRYVAAARSALAEPAFARAWENGQTLSLDDAIAFAARPAKAAPTA